MHAMNCQFNPERKCVECGLKMDCESHNCINDLKLLNSSLNNEMIELKNEIETLKKNMESMKDNHLQYVSQ
jgi:FtsZ-binding cell division protein ZapB